MKQPVRIQFNYHKSWNMPPHTTFIGVGTQFDNVFGDIEAYKKFLYSRLDTPEADGTTPRDKIKKYLRGRNLCCTCDLKDACHGDLLLQIANE